MAKDATVQIRMTEEEKMLLNKHAAELHMTLTEYLVHAGFAYQPSPEVLESIAKFNALVRQPLKSFDNPEFTQEYINEATRPLAEKLEQDKAE